MLRPKNDIDAILKFLHNIVCIVNKFWFVSTVQEEARELAYKVVKDDPEFSKLSEQLTPGVMFLPQSAQFVRTILRICWIDQVSHLEYTLNLIS